MSFIRSCSQEASLPYSLMRCALPNMTVASDKNRQFVLIMPMGWRFKIDVSLAFCVICKVGTQHCYVLAGHLTFPCPGDNT